MTVDPYAILGVVPGASEDEITAAYRRGALVHHPDRNPDDPDAARRFAELGKAVAFLRDRKRRAFFDRYGSDPEDLGVEGAALDAALAPMAPVAADPKPSRKQCPMCHGTGWRDSGRMCTHCDPDAPDKPPDTPDWDPFLTAGTREDVASKAPRPKRMRLRPATKTPKR